jgi:HEAT repeat protein
MELTAIIGPAASEAVPGLVNRLRDNYWLYRWYAAQALGRIGRTAGPDAVSALIPALDDSEAWEVRYAALEALRQIHPEFAEAAPILIKVLDNDYVRKRIVGSLTAEHAGVSAILKSLSVRYRTTI